MSILEVLWCKLKAMLKGRFVSYGLAIIVSLVLSFVFNTSPLFFNLAGKTTYAGLVSFVAFFVTFSFWFSLVVIASSTRVVGVILLALIIFLSSICLAARMLYGVVSAELGIVMYNASLEECGAYLTVQNFVLLFAVIVGIAFVLYVIKRIILFKQQRCKKIAVVVSLSVLVMSFVSPYIYRMYKQQTHNYSSKVEHTVYILRPVVLLQDFAINLYEFLSPSALNPVESIHSEVVVECPPDVVILYIGEAYRADHSVMNGYKRNTMPILSTLSNVINLPNVHSRATQTIGAIHSMLSLTSPVTGEATHNSFLSILAKHQYDNYLLVGANTNGKWYLAGQIARLLQGNTTFHSNPDSPHAYEKTISLLLDQVGGKRPVFLLIEDGAGHKPYIAENDVFGSSSEVDKYDNCLLDVDARLGAVIRAIKDKSAIILFSSNHGESFGEEGRYGHAGPLTAREQTHVCSLIWYSDKYAANHPNTVENLKKNAKKFVSHDYIYHTIISMAGISSQVQIRSQDMTLEQTSSAALSE